MSYDASMGTYCPLLPLWFRRTMLAPLHAHTHPAWYRWFTEAGLGAIHLCELLINSKS